MAKMTLAEFNDKLSRALDDNDRDEITILHGTNTDDLDATDTDYERHELLMEMAEERLFEDKEGADEYE